MNELIPCQNTLAALSVMAKTANNSKFYNSLGGEAGILSILLLARELEIPGMQALSGGIWNIQGKVEMSARFMNMKIRQAGHKLKIDMGHDKCTITGTRSDTAEELTCTFTMEDAKIAGLSHKDVWKKYPREMLFARCLSLLARMLFPDVIGNCYVEGEISDTFNDKPKMVKEEMPKAKEIHRSETTITAEVISEELPEIKFVNDEQIEQIENILQDHKDLREEILATCKIEDFSKLDASIFNPFIKRINKRIKEKMNAIRDRAEEPALV